MSNFTVFIDGDGCPVIDLATSVCKKYALDLVIVKNYAHIIKSDYGEVVTVDVSSDSADFYIVNRIKSGDILITQDYGLSAMVLNKGVAVINQNGFVIDNENIDSLLGKRHLNKVLRKQQNLYSKIPKRNLDADEKFKHNFINLIEEKIDK